MAQVCGQWAWGVAQREDHFARAEAVAGGQAQNESLRAALDVHDAVAHVDERIWRGQACESGLEVTAIVAALREAVGQVRHPRVVAIGEKAQEVVRLLGQGAHARGHDVEQVLGAARGIGRAASQLPVGLDHRHRAPAARVHQQPDRHQAAGGTAADDRRSGRTLSRRGRHSVFARNSWAALCHPVRQ